MPFHCLLLANSLCKETIIEPVNESNFSKIIILLVANMAIGFALDVKADFHRREQKVKNAFFNLRFFPIIIDNGINKEKRETKMHF